MKVILEILILKYLLFVTLALPRGKVNEFPDFSAEEKIGDYHRNGKTNDYKNFKFYRRSVQEHILKENDRKRDYATYYFRKPIKVDELYQENDSSDSNDSFDSSVDNVELLRNQFSNKNKHSKKNRHEKTSKKTSNKKQKKNKKTSSDSSESNDESDSHSREKHVDRKRKDRTSSNHSKANFYKSDDFESIEADSKENLPWDFFQSLRHSEIRNFKTTLSKKDNSKIKSLMKKLNKSSCHKKLLDGKNVPKIDVDTILQEPVKKWHKVENIIKLLLIDNYKYTEKILLSEIINNKQSSRQQISKLEIKLLEKYYLLKKDLSQTINVTKNKFRLKISKQNLNKKKIHDVERLYITQLKDQIAEKIFTFKQNIKSEIDQFQLELKSGTGNIVNHHIKLTAMPKEISTNRLYDLVSENEPIIDHEIDLSSAINTDNITSLEILKSFLTRTNEYIKHSDSLTDLNSVSHKNLNRKAIQNDSESSKNTNVNSSINGSMHKANELTHYVASGETPSLKIDNFSKLDTSSKIKNSDIFANDQFAKFLPTNVFNPYRVSSITKNEQAGLAQSSTSTADNSELVKSNTQHPIIVIKYPRKNVGIELQKNEISKPDSKGEIANGIASLSGKKPVRETNETSGLPINDTSVVDNKNLQQENLTKTHTDKATATVKNEIDTILRNNSTKSRASAVSDNTGSSSSFNHTRNTSQIKNVATGKIVTPEVENFPNFNKLSDVEHPEILIVNNDKLSKPLNDSHGTENPLSINLHIGVTNNNTIMKHQVNDLNQYHVVDIDIPDHVQESQDITLTNNQISEAKVAQKPTEANFISTQFNIVSNVELNRVIDNVNDTYDSQKYKSTLNVTNVDGNAIVNPSINNSSVISNNSNEIAQSTIAYNTEISSNIDEYNQVHTISASAIENVIDERKPVKPIDGNTGNITAQNNLGVIPHDVNAENIQNTSDANKVPRINVIPTKSDTNATNDFGAANSTDDNLQTGNSHSLLNAEANFEFQNEKENVTGYEKQQSANDIADEFITTSYHYESTTPLNNNDQIKIAHNEIIYNGKAENITFNYTDDNRQTTETIINSNSTSSKSLAGAAGSIFSENKNINFTDKPVTQTTSVENITGKTNDLYIGNSTARNIDQLVENQSQKTTQINPSTNDYHYNEATTPYSANIDQESLNKIILNDTIKVTTETPAIGSTYSYVNDEIATIPTKILDSHYLSIETTSSLDTTTNKDFHTEPKVEKTVNDNQIISSTVSAPTVESKTLQSNLDETVAPTIQNEKDTTNIVMEERDTSTTIMPENKINSTKCTDAKGAIVDCESLILSSPGNNINTNANIENEKSTMNVWPGVPQACLPLFLASDGTVLKEVPLTITIANAQTRNLCLSIAKTIIQLNYLSKVE